MQTKASQPKRKLESRTSLTIVADQQKIKPAALLLGPRNCEAVTGLPWRHVRDNARALGVPVLLVGRKAAVPAAAFLAALERSHGVRPAAAPSTPVDAARALAPSRGAMKPADVVTQIVDDERLVEMPEAVRATMLGSSPRAETLTVWWAVLNVLRPDGGETPFTPAEVYRLQQALNVIGDAVVVAHRLNPRHFELVPEVKR